MPDEVSSTASGVGDGKMFPRVSPYHRQPQTSITHYLHTNIRSLRTTPRLQQETGSTWRSGTSLQKSIRLESGLTDTDGSAMKEIVLYFQTRSTNMKNRVIGSREEYLANLNQRGVEAEALSRMYVYVYVSLFCVCSSGRSE